MKYEDNPSSIKYYVKKYLISNKERFKNKIIVDLPAGNGITSRLIREIGAIPKPFDLFPEYFNVEELECKRAEIANGIPLDNSMADFIICQEGIEHFADQVRALKEFNRILKPNGTLLITTPNYSNLRAKVSYLLTESERFHSIMPPNEIDSIWMNNQELSREIYYGHIFLTGIQKLRVLAKISGFRIKQIYKTKTKTTSFFLYLQMFPLLYFSNLITYYKNIKKNAPIERKIKKQIYREILNINLNFKVLTGSHLMIEFEKECEVAEVAGNFASRENSFGIT